MEIVGFFRQSGNGLIIHSLWITLSAHLDTLRRAFVAALVSLLAAGASALILSFKNPVLLRTAIETIYGSFKPIRWISAQIWLFFHLHIYNALLWALNILDLIPVYDLSFHSSLHSLIVTLYSKFSSQSTQNNVDLGSFLLPTISLSGCLAVRNAANLWNWPSFLWLFVKNVPLIRFLGTLLIVGALIAGACAGQISLLNTDRPPFKDTTWIINFACPMILGLIIPGTFLLAFLEGENGKSFIIFTLDFVLSTAALFSGYLYFMYNETRLIYWLLCHISKI